MKNFVKRLLGLMCLACALNANAANVNGLSQWQAVVALRITLDKATEAAVQQLGQENGFMNNAQVHLPLPAGLDDNKHLLKMIGMGKELDNVELSMNRAAEQSLPLAKLILKKSIRALNTRDAKQLLAGGDNALSSYFKNKAEKELYTQLLPLVRKKTDEVGLTAQYNLIAEKGSRLGLQPARQANLEGYVTEKTLKGLFLVIAQQERAIRTNPAGTGSVLLKRVYSK